MNEFIYNFPLIPLCAIIALLYICGSFFFQKKREYFCVTTIMAALFSSPWLIRLLTANNIVFADGIRYIAYCITVAIFAQFLFALCNTSRKTRVLKYIIFTISVLPAAVYWCYFAIQHALLNVDGVIAIWQTNFSEACEYITEYFSFPLLLLIILFAVLLFTILHLLTQNSFCLKKNKNRTIALIILFLIADGFACRASSSNSMTMVFTNAGQDVAQYMAFKKSLTARQNALSSSKTVKNILSTNQKGVYIVVIGESHNRDYMHAYGYRQKNTPWLDGMKKSRNFILFDNAYSCHTQTVPTLSYALTAKNQYNNIKLENAVSLIEAAHAAGFETVWLSNQIKYSAWDTPISVIGSEAQQQCWLNNSSGNSQFVASYDGALLKALDKIKIKDKTLIVIHLMGSHINYEMRYPHSFDKFGHATDEQSYCNSLLYNDFVMQEIYKKAQKLPNFKTLLYLSDHASVPKDKLDHDSARFTSSMTHIPMYICWSAEYEKENASKIKQLKNNKNACFTNDLLFNLQLSLMGVKLKEIYEDKNDFASAGYDTNPKRFRTSYGKRQIK